MALERSDINAGEPAIEALISPQSTEAKPAKPLIETLIFTGPTDPRRENLTKEERIRLYNAQALASGELEDLTPRYRVSDWTDNPSADWVSSDPLADPEVSRLASLIKASKQPKKD